MIGSLAQPAIVEVHGRRRLGLVTVSSNVTLGSHQYVLADSSSGNLSLALPYAGNVSGEFFTVKKISSLYDVSISGGGNTIDGYSSVSINRSANLLDPVTFFSNGHHWFMGSKPSSGMTLTQNLYLPSDDSPSIWLDGSDSSWVTLNSGNVSTWSDKSGSGHHATQSTGASQPLWSGNGLTFSGAQSMRVLNINTFASWDSDRTMIALVSYGSSAANTILHWGVSNSGFRDEQVLVSSTKLKLDESHNSGTPSNYETTSSADVGSGMSFVYRFKNSTSRERTVRFNGGVNQSTSSDRTSGSAPEDVLYLGYDRDGAGYNSAGSFAHDVTLHELIVFPSSLSDSKLQKIEGYLMHKWSMTGNLPADHPYKISQPTK
jgi:hypothetical protein